MANFPCKSNNSFAMQITSTSFCFRKIWFSHMKSLYSGINLHCCPTRTRIFALINTMWLSSLYRHWCRVKNSVVLHTHALRVSSENVHLRMSLLPGWPAWYALPTLLENLLCGLLKWTSFGPSLSDALLLCVCVCVSAFNITLNTSLYKYHWMVVIVFMNLGVSYWLYWLYFLFVFIFAKSYSSPLSDFKTPSA